MRYSCGHSWYAIKGQRNGFPGGSDDKRVCLQCGRPGFNPWVGQILWRRKLLPTPVFLPGESHGEMSLAGYSPQGRKELDTTERITLSLSKGQRNVAWVLWLCQWSPTLLATRTSFMEDNFSTDRGEDGFRMIQVLYAYWALYFYYYRISCTSDHQALDPETEDPWEIFSGISTPRGEDLKWPDSFYQGDFPVQMWLLPLLSPETLDTHSSSSIRLKENLSLWLFFCLFQTERWGREFSDIECPWYAQSVSQVALVVKNLPTGDMRLGFDPWVRKIPWRRAWQPTLVFLPGASHGQRSLAS